MILIAASTLSLTLKLFIQALSNFIVTIPLTALQSSQPTVEITSEQSARFYSEEMV